MTALLYSMALTLFLIIVLQALFQRMDWMDKPERYGYQRKPVPYGMGIVFFMSLAVLTPALLEMTIKLQALLFAAGVISLVSFWDDRVGLPALPRFAVQVACATMVVLAGVGVPALSNPFGEPFVLDSIQWTLSLGTWQIVIEPIADLVALLWIVFVMNALNWLDGAPGIVSGVSTIACWVLFTLATMADLHVIDQTHLSTLSLIVMGSSLAFLCFDFPSPKILMGDSGTMFLGLLIAVMAIFSGGKLATAFIVLAIPILDAVWTIARRLLKGQSPLKGDFQHFHHELMRAGLSERQVNLFYYVVSLSFGSAALFLQSQGKLLAILLLFGLMVVVRLVVLKRS